MASQRSGVSRARICSGKMGRRMRRKSYTPILDMAPVRTMETLVGASAYVIGSQVWNGTSGTLTANSRNTPANRKSIRVSFETDGQASFVATADESELDRAS